MEQFLLGVVPARRQSFSTENAVKSERVKSRGESYLKFAKPGPTFGFRKNQKRLSLGCRTCLHVTWACDLGCV